MKRFLGWSLKIVFFCLFLSAGMVTGAYTASVNDGFILLPGGTFQMGSLDGERQRDRDEVRHRVRVSAFYVDPYEVTQAAYEALMHSNPSNSKGGRLPVENVTWLDAVRYCNALSLHRGLKPAYAVNGEAVRWDRAADGYRLLTEAEWEYAARAGTSTVFNVGNQAHSDSVNFAGSYPYLIEKNYVTRRDPGVRTSRYRGETMAVDTLPANAFGLHHMHGNVSEWVFDYYGAYDTGRTDDPAGPSSGSLRVNRGGSYTDFGKHLRSAYRSATNPVDPDPNLGFRVCRNAAPLDEVLDTAPPSRIAMPERPRVLVACYSYSGNIRRAARIISERLGADLFEIRMRHPYRGNIYEASQVDLNKGIRPPLASRVENMTGYDVILLGYPTWWGTMPMPVLSFLESYDFHGKIIIPFSSHGGTVWGDSVSDLAKTVPGAYVGIGFEFTYSGGRDLAARIGDWLHTSGLEK